MAKPYWKSGWRWKLRAIQSRGGPGASGPQPSRITGARGPEAGEGAWRGGGGGEARRGGGNNTGPGVAAEGPSRARVVAPAALPAPCSGVAGPPGPGVGAPHGVRHTPHQGVHSCDDSNSLMGSARGCPGSTCISLVWLERCKLSLLPFSSLIAAGPG